MTKNHKPAENHNDELKSFQTLLSEVGAGLDNAQGLLVFWVDEDGSVHWRYAGLSPLELVGAAEHIKQVTLQRKCRE